MKKKLFAVFGMAIAMAVAAPFASAAPAINSKNADTTALISATKAPPIVDKVFLKDDVLGKLVVINQAAAIKAGVEKKTLHSAAKVDDAVVLVKHWDEKAPAGGLASAGNYGIPTQSLWSSIPNGDGITAKSNVGQPSYFSLAKDRALAIGTSPGGRTMLAQLGAEGVHMTAESSTA